MRSEVGHFSGTQCVGGLGASALAGREAGSIDEVKETTRNTRWPAGRGPGVNPENLMHRREATLPPEGGQGALFVLA